MTTPIVLLVGVQDGDLVAEETSGLCPPVGDQRFSLRKLQLELVPQELAELALDLLGLASWPDEPEQEVVGLCRGPDYAEEPGSRLHLTCSDGLKMQTRSA